MVIKDKGLLWSDRIIEDEDVIKTSFNVIVYVQADENDSLFDEL
jgi:hypothetical protein